MTRTNAFSILCVFIRVFALWLFATTMASLPGSYFAASQNMRYGDPLLVVLGTSGFSVTIAFVLWVFADKFARLALARPQDLTFESDLSATDWQTVAFSVLGVWLFIEGVSYTFSRVARMAIVYFVTPIGQPHAHLSDDFYAWFAADIFRMAIGVALLFGARGLVGLIRRFREFGREAQDLDAPNTRVDENAKTEP